jgi:hypothetical protein
MKESPPQDDLQSRWWSRLRLPWLVLHFLFVASLAVVYVRRDPWALAYVLPGHLERLHHDGTVALLEDDRGLFLWEVRKGRRLCDVRGPGTDYGEAPRLEMQNRFVLHDWGPHAVKRALRVCNMQTGEIFAVLGGRRFAAATLSPDGRWLLTIDRLSHEVRVLDARTGEERGRLPSVKVGCALFLPEATGVLVTGADEPWVGLWAPPDPSLLWSTQVAGAGPCYAATSPDGRRALVGVMNDGVFSVVDLGEGEVAYELDLRGRPSPRSEEQLPASGVFSSDGQRILGLRVDGFVCLFDAANGTVLCCAKAANDARGFALSTDGTRYAFLVDDDKDHMPTGLEIADPSSTSRGYDCLPTARSRRDRLPARWGGSSRTSAWSPATLSSAAAGPNGGGGTSIASRSGRRPCSG